jgi:capsular exopolysaccharide synthesis family protein
MQLEANFDLVEIVQLLWRRKRTLLLCGLVCAALVFAISLTIPRRYSAEASLVVRSEALTAPETDAAFYSSAINEAAVTTEQEVLTSDGLLKRVADSLDLTEAMVERPSITLRLERLLEQGAALAGGPALQQRVQSTLETIIPPVPVTPTSLAQARTAFVAKALTVSTTKGSSVITLRAVTKDPHLSAAIVNGVANLYMEDRLAEQGRTAKTIEAALRERLSQTRRQIAEGEDRLVKLLQEPGAIENSEVPGALQGMNLLGAQLIQAQADLARRKSEYDSAVAMRDHGGAAGAPDSLSYMVSGDLRRQLSALQQQDARLAASFQPDSPARRALQQQIGVVQSSIASEASRGIEQRRTEMAAAQATVNSLQQQVDSLRQRRQSQSSSTIDVDRQRQAVASLWRISDALDTRLIDLAARPVNPNARILTVGVPATMASYPSKGIFTLAGFLVGTVGAGAMLLLINHIRRLRPLAIHLAQQLNAPLLGGFPATGGTLGGAQRKLLRSAIGRDIGDGLAATLRGVALELEDVIHEDNIRCLMVTSGKSGEGKTTVSISLGRSLAAMPMRVLLIDLDLRRPSVERVFAASVSNPLEDHVERIGPKTVLRVRRDQQSGLHVLTPIPSGGDDPISYLRSPALRDMVALARNVYDLILFDTPPVMSVPDAIEVARLADGILLVTEIGRSDEASRAELTRRLARTRKPICGVVATKVAEADLRSGTYSGYAPLRLAGRGAPAPSARDATFEQAS